MISTVTVSTVAILTDYALAGSAAFSVILVLLSLLVQKELAGTSANDWMKRLERALNLAILPMLIAFFITVIMKVAEVLRY